jgi:glycosyltransferase involved in cell wall biosynthesis
VRELAALFRSFRPDVLHVHNSFPLISPSLYWVAHRHRCAVVQTLHNFRLLGPQAMLLRDGKPCEDCLGHLPWRAALHGCYRDSRLQSAVVITMLGAHRAAGTYARKVTRYIALNAFCRDKFVQGGLPAERISIKPNFVDLVAQPPEGVRSGALFVGRLSQEKGVSLLARALAQVPQIHVDVVGTGPESGIVAAHPQMRAVGALPRSQVLERMRRAAYLVMPSIWYETFGMVMLEAFACGVPVIAPRMGAMEEFVDHLHTGLLFDPSSADALADSLAWAERYPEEIARMGTNARKAYLARYTPERNYEELVAIYAAAMKDAAAGRTASSVSVPHSVEEPRSP